MSKIIKLHERCFLCKSLEFCAECDKCPSCCSRSTCRGQYGPILGKMGSLGDQLQGHKNPQRRLQPSRLDHTKCHKHHLWLCTSYQYQLPDRGIRYTCANECNQNLASLGFFKRLFWVPKPNNHSEQISTDRVIRNGNYNNLPSDKGVGNIHRL